MLAALLALASSLSWGLSDFIGGMQSRRHAVLAVMVLSQGLALALLAVTALAGAPTEHDGVATAYAAGGGAVGICALGAFYRALSIGTMSVVAPISATGTAIPVIVGLAQGERPSALQVTGIALAALGVVLAGREVPAAGKDERRGGRAAVALALLAAIGFGSFFACVDRAEESADVTWVLLSARTPAVALLLAAALLTRPALPRDRGSFAALAAIGVFDLGANALFVVAAGEGLLSVVGTLGSLYPAVTVILARYVLDERLSRAQSAGVVAALAGVVAMAAG
jgi:drug/metabolite transporter (DMT)-like permease